MTHITYMEWPDMSDNEKFIRLERLALTLSDEKLISFSNHDTNARNFCMASKLIKERLMNLGVSINNHNDTDNAYDPSETMRLRFF